MDGYTSINNKNIYKQGLIGLLIITLTIAIIFCNINIVSSTTYASVNSSAITMEISTNRVLYGKNIDVRLPMASTTKAMTALVVIENSNMEDIVTITQKAVGVEGSSIYLKEGEKLSVKELLYGLMLRSGNDAATALAIYTGKNVENFVEMMNQKAVSLNLKNTHFENPHGLHNNNHYTSSYDLAVIACEAMKNPIFKEIVGTKKITISGNDYDRYLYNKNKILINDDGGTGIKTGYTKNAGRCLIASSQRNGMEVVSIVLNCGPMFEECSRLMDNAYAEYEMVNVIKSGEDLGKIIVEKGKSKFVSVCTKEDVLIPLKKDGSENCNIKMNLKQKISAPCEKGRNVGNIEISINDCLLFNENVYTMEKIEKKGALDYLKEFFER